MTEPVTAAAAAPAAKPVPPTPPPTKYPQYGLMPSSGHIVEAHTSAEKVADIEQGYVDWFQTKQEAVNAYQGMQGFFGSGSLNLASLIPGLSGLEEIGHFVGSFVSHITDVHMWISIGWILLGIVMLVVGLLMWLRKSDMLPSVVPVPV